MSVHTGCDADAPDPQADTGAWLGAALQKLLLAAHGFGYGAITLSGRGVGAHALRSGWAVVGDEQLVAFVTIGTPRNAPPRRRAAELPRHLAEWPRGE